MNVHRWSERRIDWMLLGTSLILMLAAASGLTPLTISILVVAGLPLVGFLALGHIPSRGAAVAVFVLILGVLSFKMGNPSQSVGAGQLALLSSMTVTSMLVGVRVNRDSAMSSPIRSPGCRWMSIEVQTERPPDVGGELVRPKVAPSSGPERRGLARFLRPKFKRWKVRPIGSVPNES
jgi:hypothetical protein